MKRRLFIDMDGTLANFHANHDCLERMHQPGYFTSLAPFSNVISAVKLLCESAEVFILSAVSGYSYDRTVEEKIEWLKKHGIEMDSSHLLFPLCCESKVNYVKLMTGHDLSSNDILLDDFNDNLEEWRAAGGTAVKFVNDFNDKGKIGPLWDGKRIRYDWGPQYIFLIVSQIWALTADENSGQMTKKGNVAYWDDIDHLAEQYLRELLTYSASEVKLEDEFGDEDYYIMAHAKEITEFVVSYLEKNTNAKFPYVEGDF